MATPAMVLYAGNKELENEIKKNGLINTAKKIKNGLTQIGIEQRIGDNYDGRSNKAVETFIGQDTAGMLDLAHGINMNDRDYIKDTISLDNYNDSKVTSDKEYLKKKVSEQFKDYNFDINKIKGYFFKSNSKPSQRLIENKDFQDMIKNHKQEILEKGEFSEQFNFNKNEDSPLIKAGASQMEKGSLKPFFTIHDIIIPKNKLDEIWK